MSEAFGWVSSLGLGSVIRYGSVSTSYGLSFPGNRSHRVARTRAAHSEHARAREESLIPADALYTVLELILSSWVRGYGARLVMCSGGLDTLHYPPNRLHITGLAKEPDPKFLIWLSAALCSPALDAVNDTFCLENHQTRPLGERIIRIRHHVQRLLLAVPIVSRWRITFW